MLYFLCLFLSIFSTFAAENDSISETSPKIVPSLKRTTQYHELGPLFSESKEKSNEKPLDSEPPSEVEPDTKKRKLNPYQLFEMYVDMGKIPYQGWKIYVSANPNEIDFVRNKVTPLLITRKINYKIIKNDDAYLDLNSNLEERGKFITIYPQDEEEAYLIAIDLNTTLSSIERTVFTPISACIPLGQSGGLWTRYGQFKGTWPTKAGKVLVVTKKDQFLKSENQGELFKRICLDNVFTLDDRTIPFPDFVHLSWLPFGTLSYIFPHASTFPNSTIDFSNHI